MTSSHVCCKVKAHNPYTLLDKIRRSKKKERKTTWQRRKRLGKDWNKNSWQHRTKKAKQQREAKETQTKAKERGTESVGIVDNKDIHLENVPCQAIYTEELEHKQVLLPRPRAKGSPREKEPREIGKEKVGKEKGKGGGKRSLNMATDMECNAAWYGGEEDNGDYDDYYN